MDGLEDVMVTFRRQLYVIRLVNPEPQISLLVILDRDRVNLAMARREIRAFCASFAQGNQPRSSIGGAWPSGPRERAA